jgi:hypothetical protein
VLIFAAGEHVDAIVGDDVVVQVSLTPYYVSIDWWDENYGWWDNTIFTNVEVSTHGQVERLSYLGRCGSRLPKARLPQTLLALHDTRESKLQSLAVTVRVSRGAHRRKKLQFLASTALSVQCEHGTRRRDLTSMPSKEVKPGLCDLPGALPLQLNNFLSENSSFGVKEMYTLGH